MLRRIILFIVLLLIVGCSLKPERMVTRKDLEKARIYRMFRIKESPEQVLDALNTYGEVVLSAERNIPNRKLPVHVKILATSHGLEVVDYDR